MVRPFITAIRTLTVIPVWGKEAQNYSWSLLYFPVIGLLLGGIVWCIAFIFKTFSIQETILFALASLFILSWLTGFLHIDGLGDVADAFGGGKDTEQIITILKDSRMGTFGVAAIFFDLMTKLFCWKILYERNHISIIILSLLMGRSLQAIFLTFLPGAGKDSSVIHRFKQPLPYLKTILVLCVFTAIGGSFFIVSYDMVLIAVIFSLAVSGAFGYVCHKKIGGITGDCVGAMNELVELSVVITGVFWCLCQR